MEALPLPPPLPRPREDDVVEVDGRDCTGIILELLSAADITHKKTSAGDGDGARADLLLRMLLEMPPSPMQRGNIDGDEGGWCYCDGQGLRKQWACSSKLAEFSLFVYIPTRPPHT